jgi:dipeptidyl aminopeptidase/acylaminoacyl peptidase
MFAAIKNFAQGLTMRIRTGLAALSAAAILALILSVPDARAAPPQVEAYGMLPLIEHPALSPDGTMVALLTSLHGRRCVAVHDLDVVKPPQVVCPGRFEVKWFAWKTNNRLLVSVYASTMFRGQRLVSESRLLGMNVDGSNIKELISPREGRFINYSTDNVLDFLKDDPDHILLTAFTMSAIAPDIFKVDVNSGDKETLVASRDNIFRWITDDKGRPRLGMALVDRKLQFLYRDDLTSDFTKVDGMDIIGESGFVPLGLAEQPGMIYVMSNHETGRNCIYLYDIKNRKIVDRYASEPDFDIEGMIWHDKRPIGYTYSDDVSHQVFIDPAWKHDADSIARSLPGSRILLIDRTDDGHRVLVEVAEGNLPPTFYVLTRKPGQKTTLDPLGAERPYIPEDSVAPMKPVTYRSRDGLQIHAYLTLPVGVTKGPIPFVVLPHGGPWARDFLGFDYLSQMIASRGYGVLQPNFRGSTGYGGAFLAAGFREWGRKMQDDVTDGTRWLIDQKLADPSRICIVGWSYGGYAALMGVVREPTLYRCAASMAGVTDLRHLMPVNGALFSALAVPQLDGDKSLMDVNSPARNADKMNVPILLAHGRQDVNVSVKDSEEMERALRDAGKHVDAIYFDSDDHFLFEEGDRIAFLKKLEGFLKENLGAPPN